MMDEALGADFQAVSKNRSECSSGGSQIQGR